MNNNSEILSNNLCCIKWGGLGAYNSRFDLVIGNHTAVMGFLVFLS